MKKVYIVSDENQTFTRKFTNKNEAIKHADALKIINHTEQFIVFNAQTNPYIDITIIMEPIYFTK